MLICAFFIILKSLSFCDFFREDSERWRFERRTLFQINKFCWKCGVQNATALEFEEKKVSVYIIRKIISNFPYNSPLHFNNSPKNHFANPFLATSLPRSFTR